MKISLIIPARNEERLLGGCLQSVREAAERAAVEVETVVVLNRCTDGTEQIARAAGALVVCDDTKCLAHIRNTGAKASSGEILVTIDADSRMSPNLLAEIAKALRDERVVGGSVRIMLERLSLGLVLTLLLLLPILLVMRISGGSFWVRRETYFALGGFDERLRSFEDVDFALRLRRHARSRGKRARILLRGHIVTSCRKFDRFGDWYLLRRPSVALALVRHCADPRLEDELWYDAGR
ncbi:MAG: glycosyltransferase [Deltaproteobacteria bacterium]|nr:glycosyltransferase [Deltaproteobacteria bacterium]